MTYQLIGMQRKNSFEDSIKKKIVVGVAGGSAAGKTTLCETINRQMAFDRNFKVLILSLDSFYKNVDKKEYNISDYNFDHPNSIDFDLAYSTLDKLIHTDEQVAIPEYSFIEHARMPQQRKAGPANVIFFEGLMVFYDKRIRDLLTYKIFINCDDDIRLCRRLLRDTTERGRTVQNVLGQYNRFVKNAFRDFILPSMVHADIIIPGSRCNRVSVDFIVQHIQNMARRLYFREKIERTTLYFFGESEIYDLDFQTSDDSMLSPPSETFLVFPTSHEHKKQLQFYMSMLLSQLFSMEYFKEIYCYQFLKIMKLLVNQLIQFKKYQLKDMEVLTSFYAKDYFLTHNSNRPVKLILFPVAESNDSDELFSQIKNFLAKTPKTTIIILNFFCDRKIPAELYSRKLSNVIMINLFVIGNFRRLKETFINNNTGCMLGDWFKDNPTLANEGVEIFGKQLGINVCSQSQIQQKIFNQALITKKLKPNTVDQTKEKWNIIQQKNVLPQQHPNLCGFHAINTVICLQQSLDVLSRPMYQQNCFNLNKKLNTTNFAPFERFHLQILRKKLIINCNISQFIYSFNYVQSSQEQITEIQTLFQKLIQTNIPYFYILCGIYDHYILLKIQKQRILYFDSSNTPLTNVINDIETENASEQQLVQNKKRRNNIKQALQIVLDLHKGRNLADITIQKVIDDIVDSFNAAKLSNTLDNWLLNDYPKPVLMSSLIAKIKNKPHLLKESSKDKLLKWLEEPLIIDLLNVEERNIKL